MDDKTISLEEFKGLIRARLTEAPSLRQCAAELGITHAYLSRILNTALPPGPKVLKRLGYARVIRYTRKIGK